MEEIDGTARIDAIRCLIQRKRSLRQFYRACYQRWAESLTKSSDVGFVLELGAGAGFSKTIIPQIITSDILPYDGVDMVIDATALPFPDHSLRMICMLNVFHHISNATAFFEEVRRCLTPGGRLFLTDQHLGLFSSPILKYAHHEPFRPNARQWAFQSTGPLSGANGALTWIIFKRDKHRFQTLFPELKIHGFTPHTPLQYWMSGGLKEWNLIPDRGCELIAAMDRFLVNLSPKMGSFVDIEIIRVSE